MPEIPILETDRLRLRGHRVDDFAASAAMWGDPIVTRHIGGRPFTGEECWSRLLRYAGHWALLGYGYWAITDKESGRFIGEAGLADYRRGIEMSFAPCPEAGWALVPEVHGKGFATEAMLAITDWGDRHLPDAQTFCLIDPTHGASVAVATKAGYAEAERATYKDHPVVLFTRAARRKRPAT